MFPLLKWAEFDIIMAYNKKYAKEKNIKAQSRMGEAIS